MRERLSISACTMSLLFASGSALAQESEGDRPLVLFVGDQLMYDDNLFRLPDTARRDPSERPVAHTEDYINQLTAGLRTRMHMGRQELRFIGRVNDVQFRNNDQLDYTGGAANLMFDWQLGARLSGQVSGNYERTLASYTNYRFFERDIVEAIGGELELRFELGPRFALLSGARSRRTDHSDDDRRAENFESDSGRVGIEYSSSASDRFIVEYRYLEGDFPDSFAPGSADARDRSYEETLLNFRTEYELTSKLHFRGNVGNLERTYPPTSITDDYSGAVWRGTLEWQPRSKLGFELSAYRDLKAYVDAESNYFVADGASFGPTWNPSEKLGFALEYIYEEQDYIGTPSPTTPGSDEPILEVDPGREDEVDVARLTASYAPRDFLELDLTWAYIERTSNRPTREYDSQVASMAIRIVF